MKIAKVSKLLVKRLELYLNYLKTLPDTVVNISATSIARALELGDVQVRKDLARVSDGGRCRTGHVRQRLIRDIEKAKFSQHGITPEELREFDNWLNGSKNIISRQNLWRRLLATIIYALY